MGDAIILAPRLDLPAASELVTQLLSVSESDSTTLDASHVVHIGALCAQALIAAGIRSSSGGGSLDITNASERVETQLASMGLTLDAIKEGRA